MTPAPTPTASPSVAGCQGCTGGTLYLLKNATDFDYYDPQRIYTPEDEAFFGATIMRSLVAYKYSADPADVGTLVPDMATDTGTRDANATTWTFTLRDGLTWQDGSPVKCEDVKYGVSRTFATDVINGGPTYAIQFLNIPKDSDGTSQYKGPYSGQGQDLFDKAVTCDGNTITFHLTETVPDFNYATTLGFGAVPNPVDHPGVDTGENYVGTDVWSDGPYRITSYTPDQGGSLIMDRNPNWNSASDGYRGAYPDKWEVDFGLDPEKIDQRLIQSTGNDSFAIGYAGLEPQDTPEVFADPHTVLPAFQTRAFIGLNQATSYFWIDTTKVTNREIRAAMVVALDREAIRDNRGGAYVGDFADGALNPSIGMDYAPTGLWDGLLGQPVPPNGDPEYAKTLVAQSGEVAPSLTWSYFSNPSSDAEAAIVQRSLEKAGFRVALDALSPHGCAGCLPQLGDFGPPFGYPTYLSSDYPSASTVIPVLYPTQGGWGTSNVSNESGIPDWTERVADAETTLDRTERAMKWRSLNTDAAGQAWTIPLLFGISNHLGGTNVGNLFRWAPYASWPYSQLYVRYS